MQDVVVGDYKKILTLMKLLEFSQDDDYSFLKMYLTHSFMSDTYDMLLILY